MEKATLEFYPNGLQLLYVVQGGMGGWGKGSSLQEATKNFKKFNKRTKPSFVHVFALKSKAEPSDGLNDIEVSWNGITYQTDKVVLLSYTPF
jgi:hypothetical protein